MTYTFKVGAGKSHEDPEDVESQIFVTRDFCIIVLYRYSSFTLKSIGDLTGVI